MSTSAVQETLWFGGGFIYGINTGDGATPSLLVPGNFGTIQEASVDFSVTQKELRGAYEDPEAIASASRKITGKITTGRVNLENLNQFVFGETLATGTTLTANFEPQTAVDNAFTVDNYSTFSQDLGVWYANNAPGNNQIQLVPVPFISPPTLSQGEYTVDSDTGEYVVSSADNGVPLLVSYQYTTTSGHNLVVHNKVMGLTTRPIFSLYLNNQAEGDNDLVLFACRATKFTMPIKREDFVIMDIEFQAYANNSGETFQFLESV